MKRFSILALSALALLVNACERHPAADLPPEHATAFGEHAWAPGQAPKHGEHGDSHAPAASEAHGAPAAAEHAPAPAAAAATAPAHGEAPAGEAPKFFPEKK